MSFDSELREIIKHQVEGHKGQINPKDDFAGFIFDIKSLIGKYSLKPELRPMNNIGEKEIKEIMVFLPGIDMEITAMEYPYITKLNGEGGV